jgi:transposase InsO family protein
MRNNSSDETIKRNYIQKYRFLINEYELVKNKKHPNFRFVKDFYKAYDTDRRSFLKYYNRFKLSGNDTDLLPAKRGPKWKTRRTIPFIENKVITLREKGLNRYEIVSILKPGLKKFTPSPSGVYKIIKRHGLNRLKPKMKQNKRRIIKEKAGEMAHIDSHYLSKSIIQGQSKHRYLVCVIDSCTRIAWAEVVEDIKSLTVMFAVLKSFNVLADHYNIKFKEVLTDNGPEFGPNRSKKKDEHPFERMLIELDIKHRYIRPYRPQTNGKVERFWRTIEDDLLRETTFDNIEELKEELLQYIYYYNHHRPHQGLEGKIPAEFAESCPRIT